MPFLESFHRFSPARDRPLSAFLLEVSVFIINPAVEEHKVQDL